MVRFGARRVDPKWIISGRFSGRRKENPDPWSEEKRAKTQQSPAAIPTRIDWKPGRVSGFPSRLATTAPSSFRSATTTAIPSRSATTEAPHSPPAPAESGRRGRLERLAELLKAERGEAGSEEAERAETRRKGEALERLQGVVSRLQSGGEGEDDRRRGAAEEVRRLRDNKESQRRSAVALGLPSSEFFPIRKDRDPSATTPLPIGDDDDISPSSCGDRRRGRSVRTRSAEGTRERVIGERDARDHEEEENRDVCGAGKKGTRDGKKGS
ncbi:hypothetical protein Taro_019240 [Colocasia esculenta]|uniref:Uncharacterized protein n=1 Tax=Colocasia esculenta TaxID=4460 RepID=A0A843UT97_COLES|nr:hypothetical protein [Colocasia esculenta]